mmetsp:Transcript_37099/g.76052  ORF Transcript_37099/g.76052 Transcript_37099/m.76052 type:complete len:226 (+) Transcript_37099:259-936(+)
MLDDLQWLLEVHQCVDAVPRRVLDRELFLDQRLELRISLDTLRKLRHPVHKLVVRDLETLPTLLVRCVKDGAVIEHNAQILDRVVSVLQNTAAHPRRIVVHDTPNPARLDRRGVRPELASVRSEHPIHLSQDPSWLHSDDITIVFNLSVPPRVSQLEQNRVCDGLSGEGSPSGPERHGGFVLARCLYKLDHLHFVMHLDNNFRDKPVETCVRSVRECAQRIGENA